MKPLTLDEIPALGPDEAHDRRVQMHLENERAKREARRILAAEDRPIVPPLDILTLRARLSRPRPRTGYRIARWQPRGTRILLAAQYKAGKSTLVGNVVRSLVDAEPFLGTHVVAPIAGSLVHLDFEMAEGQFLDWQQALRIRNDDRVIPILMRGRASAFDILDPQVRAEWAGRFRDLGAAYCVLDCIRPVLDALGLDEHREAGRFLVAFDALLEEAGIEEALTVQHMGHTGERSRGDSRFRDWPDVEWRLVRKDEDPSSPRFISAFGRDVEIEEAALEFEASTRALTLVGGSRQDMADRQALEAVVEVLRTSPEPMSGRSIKTALEDSDVGRNQIDAALKIGRRDGVLQTVNGPRRAVLYRLPVSQCPAVSRECTGDTEFECPAAYIKRDTQTLTQGGDSEVSQRDTQACCEGGSVQLRCRLCRNSPTYYNGVDAGLSSPRLQLETED
jgi:hypothetical protein